MYEILAKLIIGVSLAQLGLRLTDSSGRLAINEKQIRRAQQDVLHMSWRPITVFPTEAARFRK